MQTNLSEEQITKQDIKNMFEYIDKQGYEYIHTLEIIPDDKSKEHYFIQRDNIITR
jgi:hypothetical protein